MPFLFISSSSSTPFPFQDHCNWYFLFPKVTSLHKVPETFLCICVLSPSAPHHLMPSSLLSRVSERALQVGSGVESLPRHCSQRKGSDRLPHSQYIIHSSLKLTISQTLSLLRKVSSVLRDHLTLSGQPGPVG